MREKSFNKVVVHRSALENNFKYIQKTAGPQTPVMAMVKADAYGHGMEDAALAFASAGCTRFGVAELCEGVRLRLSGITGDIYVTIGFDLEDVDSFFSYDLIPVVYSFEAVSALSKKALSLGRNIGVHLKVDTGMSRLGLLPENVGPFLNHISELKGVKVVGVMSHLPASDQPLSGSTETGLKNFDVACGELDDNVDTICHIANSGAVLNFPDAHCDMVRAGIALYGYDPAGQVGGKHGGRYGDKSGLVPAMSFHSRVLQVKELPAGTGISYGHTFVTEKSTKIAIIPVGYEDGFSRSLSNSGEVLIHGELAPVCGRICMNMCMIDVSTIAGVQAGDEVVLMGTQGQKEISADDIAAKIGTISYEVLCMFGNNNSREYQVG